MKHEVLIVGGDESIVKSLMEKYGADDFEFRIVDFPAELRMTRDSLPPIEELAKAIRDDRVMPIDSFTNAQPLHVNFPLQNAQQDICEILKFGYPMPYDNLQIF